MTTEKRFSLRTLLRNIFCRKGKVIILGEGALSSKIVLLGTMKDMPGIGVLKICRYRDGKQHEFGEKITDDMVGSPVVTILFGRKEEIRRMSDGLCKLYLSMEGEA